MIGSLKVYLGCAFRLLKSLEGRKLIVAEIDKQLYLKAYRTKVDERLKWKALTQALGWLDYSQSKMKDDGFGTYYLCRGWTSSYPETSGYIIPTLIRYANAHNNKEVLAAAHQTLEWLLVIQKPEGGWQSGYVHQNREAVVFNTGQVIRGMLAGYKQFGDARFLNAAIKAADWISSIQHADGYFNQHVYLNKARVYDSYVVAPMLAIDYELGENRYRDVAIKQLHWIINSKQNELGWFADCDNTIKRNQKPIIHTIAYTIDGILDCALLLKDPLFFKSAEKPAKKLLELFLTNGKLHGRYDSSWHGSEAFITTGGAQLAIIWHKLFLHTQDAFYQKGVVEMNNLLTAIQQRATHEARDTRGALFGSFPMWGRYESFGCPNWATKYFADSLMNEAGYVE